MEVSGWVEVMFGEETRKDRSAQYFVVPQSYEIGDVAIDLDFSIDSVDIKIETKQPKDKPRQILSNKSDKKLSVGSVFYWFCEPCRTPNEFLRKNCKSCDIDRNASKSSPSALLELVENVCIADDTNEAEKGIPPVHRQSIPPGVVTVVQNLLTGNDGTTNTSLNMETILLLDSVFYWQCVHCTFSNSFRRWSCKACRQKVSHYQISN